MKKEKEEILEDLGPYFSYRQRITKEFFIRGLIVPVSQPLDQITKYCQRQCEKFCIGKNGMFTLSKIQLFGIFCPPVPNGLDEETKKFLSGKLKKEEQ